MGYFFKVFAELVEISHAGTESKIYEYARKYAKAICEAAIDDMRLGLTKSTVELESIERDCDALQLFSLFSNKNHNIHRATGSRKAKRGRKKRRR